MPLTNQARDDFGDGFFLHVAIPSIGDPTGLPAAATEGAVEIALSTGTLTTATTLMTQTQISYTGYARITPPRTGSGWTSVNGAIDNVALEQFGNMSGGAGGTVSDFNLTFDEGADYAQWFGLVDTPLAVTTGVNPQFAIGAFNLTIT